MPSVRETLFAVPIGSTVTGTFLPIIRRATLPMVPSPPATATRSASFLSALDQPFSFTDW
jgi:hypothetical protein